MSNLDPQYQILLYYMYVPIDYPEHLKRDQIILCKDLNLKGRIIIAHEGINGTVCGLKNDTEKYVEIMKSDSRFTDMHIKRSIGLQDAFPNINVKVRNEIVTASLEENDIDPNVTTGKRLKPEELKQWIEQGKDFLIIDMRNDYEHRLGKFKNSIEPETKTFKELPQKMNRLKEHQSKTVVTVCTGGVRCEKASGYLVKNGFNDVYQLDGGIVSYMEKFPGEDFEGSLFVFDKRQTMHFQNPSDFQPIGTCDHCDQKTNRMRNCKDPFCNKKFIVCDDCFSKENTSHCPACVHSFTSVQNK